MSVPALQLSLPSASTAKGMGEARDRGSQVIRAKDSKVYTKA